MVPEVRRVHLVFAFFLALSLVPLYFLLPPSWCSSAWLFTLGYILTVPGAVLAVYYVYIVTRRITVDLEGDEVVIRYGLGELRIPGGTIGDASFEPRVSLYLRLGGMSLPGLHLGYYSSSLGRVWAFLNRLDRVVRIDLRDGRRILVSPESPLTFAERIRELARRAARVERSVVARSRDGVAIAASLTLAVIIAAYFLAFIYPSMPERVPVHFSTNMQPDRWGPKTTYLGVFALVLTMAFFLAIISGIIGRTSPGLGYITVPMIIGSILMMLGAAELALCFSGV